MLSLNRQLKVSSWTCSVCIVDLKYGTCHHISLSWNTSWGKKVTCVLTLITKSIGNDMTLVWVRTPTGRNKTVCCAYLAPKWYIMFWIRKEIWLTICPADVDRGWDRLTADETAMGWFHIWASESGHLHVLVLSDELFGDNFRCSFADTLCYMLVIDGAVVLKQVYEHYLVLLAWKRPQQ